MDKERQPDKWLCLLLNRNRMGNRLFLVLNEFCNLHGKLQPSALSAGDTKYSYHRSEVSYIWHIILFMRNNTIHSLRAAYHLEPWCQPGSEQMGFVRKYNHPLSPKLLIQIFHAYASIPSSTGDLCNHSHHDVSLTTLGLTDHWLLYFLSNSKTSIICTYLLNSLDNMVPYSNWSNTLNLLAHYSFCHRLFTKFWPWMNSTFGGWLKTQQGRIISLLAHARQSSDSSQLFYNFSTLHWSTHTANFPQFFFPFSIHLHQLNSHSHCCCNQQMITFYFREAEKPLNGNALTFPYQAHKTVFVFSFTLVTTEMLSLLMYSLNTLLILRISSFLISQENNSKGYSLYLLYIQPTMPSPSLSLAFKYLKN